MNWKDLKDSQSGTCLIIGNGPSLNDIPLDFLKKYKSFGSNRIYLKLTPDYYASVNPLVVEQFCHEIDRMDCVKFITTTNGMNWTVRDSLPLKSNGMPIFSFWPDKWIYEGYTVTYVLMQLAYFMGFTTALLVGVDHRFSYEGKPNEERKLQGDDPNHFDPSYFANVKWNNPDLAGSEKAYRLAKIAWDNNGRKIINLTPNSDLDVFPFDDWRNY